MAKAAKKAPAKRAQQHDDDAGQDVNTNPNAHPTAPQMSTVLSAPKPDPDRAPRRDNIGAKDRQDLNKEDPNGEDEGPDKVYGIASRARWNSNAPIQELNADSQAAEELAAADNREE